MNSTTRRKQKARSCFLLSRHIFLRPQQRRCFVVAGAFGEQARVCARKRRTCHLRIGAHKTRQAYAPKLRLIKLWTRYEAEAHLLLYYLLLSHPPRILSHLPSPSCSLLVFAGGFGRTRGIALEKSYRSHFLSHLPHSLSCLFEEDLDDLVFAERPTLPFCLLDTQRSDQTDQSINQSIGLKALAITNREEQDQQQQQQQQRKRSIGTSLSLDF